MEMNLKNTRNDKDNWKTKTVGQILKEARLDKNLTIQDVSLGTNIQNKYIHAMENGKHEVFPSRIYLTGFLTVYAKFLSLPQEMLLLKLKNEILLDQESPLKELTKPVTLSSRKKKYLIMGVSFGFMLTLLIGFGYYYMANRAKSVEADQENRVLLSTDSLGASQELNITLGESFTLSIEDKLYTYVVKNITVDQVSLYEAGENRQYLLSSKDTLVHDINDDGVYDYQMIFVPVKEEGEQKVKIQIQYVNTPRLTGMPPLAVVVLNNLKAGSKTDQLTLYNSFQDSVKYIVFYSDGTRRIFNLSPQESHIVDLKLNSPNRVVDKIGVNDLQRVRALYDYQPLYDEQVPSTLGIIHMNYEEDGTIKFDVIYGEL